jgi:Ran GTPase-activating protein (RanGAP) involved in mRNA processing and transport
MDADNDPANVGLLDLSYKQMDDAEAMDWANQLHMYPNLVALDMSSNRIREEGVLALVEGLEKCPKLKRFNIGNNPLTNQGILYIARMFRYISSDVNIGISLGDSMYNKFCREGRKHLVYKTIDTITTKPSDTSTALGKFINQDGDHALLARILRWLLDAPHF